MLIPAENIEKLKADIEDLNKRARRLDVPEIVLNVSTLPVYDTDENGGKIQFFDVELEGDEIRLPGWEFVAAIEHLEEGNIIYRNPRCEDELPSGYQECKSICDHCGTKRYRKKTYVLVKKSETFAPAYVQVGSTCLKDFVGHGDPEALARLAEKIWELDLDEYTERERHGTGERFFETQEVLGFASVAIRKYGYISRNKAEYEGLEATADTVRKMVLGDTSLKIDLAEDFYPTEEDRANAEKAQEYCKTLLKDEEPNDFFNNLTVLSHCENVSYRHIGLASGMMLMYLKDCIWEPAKQALKDMIKDEHFGTVKKREEFELRVVFTRLIDGFHGFRTMIKFVDRENRQAIWWASGNKMDMFEVDTWLWIKATVKEHGEYDGKKQTIINRAEVLNELVPTA